MTEIDRVRSAVAALRAGDLAELGRLFDASHSSLRDDYEVSCAELDVSVEAARAAGALGARMTGGGFGGSSIALVPAGASTRPRAHPAPSPSAAGRRRGASWSPQGRPPTATPDRPADRPAGPARQPGPGARIPTFPPGARTFTFAPQPLWRKGEGSVMGGDGPGPGPWSCRCASTTPWVPFEPSSWARSSGRNPDVPRLPLTVPQVSTRVGDVEVAGQTACRGSATRALEPFPYGGQQAHLLLLAVGGDEQHQPIVATREVAGAGGGSGVVSGAVHHRRAGDTSPMSAATRSTVDAGVRRRRRARATIAGSLLRVWAPQSVNRLGGIGEAHAQCGGTAECAAAPTA